MLAATARPPRRYCPLCRLQHGSSWRFLLWLVNRLSPRELDSKPAGRNDGRGLEDNARASVVSPVHVQGPAGGPFLYNLDARSGRRVRKGDSTHARPVVAVKDPGEPPPCILAWRQIDCAPFAEVNFDAHIDLLLVTS